MFVCVAETIFLVSFYAGQKRIAYLIIDKCNLLSNITLC
jgi:hypothetical protein